MPAAGGGPISTTAVSSPSPSIPNVASTFMSGSGPVTRRVMQFPARRRNQGPRPFPSPPSAMGQSSLRASGCARRMPAAIASATSAAVRQPLNLSGAMRIFMRPSILTLKLEAEPIDIERRLECRLVEAGFDGNGDLFDHVGTQLLRPRSAHELGKRGAILEQRRE